MAEASYPADLLYHAEHDWARLDPQDAEHATLGITWFAQDALGEVVFFEAPSIGATLTQGEPYAEIESVKAVSEVIAPLSGEVLAVNDALTEEPQVINEDPYGAGWLVEVRLSNPSERGELLDAETYSATLGG
jgi:glycine cleavage system H protein